MESSQLALQFRQLVSLHNIAPDTDTLFVAARHHDTSLSRVFMQEKIYFKSFCSVHQNYCIIQFKTMTSLFLVCVFYERY